MSTDRTGAAQLARLIELGLTVRLLPPLRDVDMPADAEQVAYAFPELVFSRTHARLVADPPGAGVRAPVRPRVRPRGVAVQPWRR